MFNGLCRFIFDTSDEPWVDLQVSESTEDNLCRPGLRTSESCPSMGQHWLPLSFKKVSGSCKLGGAKSVEFTRVEWGKSSTRERWHQPFGYRRERLNRGTKEAFPQALALKLHKSVSPYMSLACPPLLSSTGAQCECMEMRESVHQPFKGTPWVPSYLLSHLDRQNCSWFLQPDVVESCSSQHWHSNLEGPVCGWVLLVFRQESLWPRSLSWFSIASHWPCQCRVSTFPVFAPPNSLKVISSLYP